MDISLKLTPAERLILIGQMEIKMMLRDPYDEDEKDFFKENEELISVLQSGYEAEYDRISSFLSEPLSEENCNFVFDIMQMFKCLKTKFPGFNEHNEGKYLGYANYLLKSGKIEIDEFITNTKLMAASSVRSIERYKKALKLYCPHLKM
ncbi:MAG: YfbU family protein [Victivallales bacterium]|nr:YfbU family protein [Victivallales bacterium]